jgi:OPA family glycerol-3-phosphate transporter-like MFS transporter
VIKAAVIFYVAAASALILLLAAGNRNVILSAVLFSVITASMMAVNTLFVNLYPLKFKQQGRVSAVSGFLNALAYLGTAFSTFSIGILVQRQGWNVTMFSWIIITLLAMVVCQMAATREAIKSEPQYSAD